MKYFFTNYNCSVGKDGWEEDMAGRPTSDLVGKVSGVYAVCIPLIRNDYHGLSRLGIHRLCSVNTNIPDYNYILYKLWVLKSI